MNYTDEEIINALEHCAKRMCNYDCPLFEDMNACLRIDQLSLDLIKRQQEELDKRQWISVDDRLPEKDSRVLVAFRSEKSSDGIEDCYFSGMRNRFVLYHTFEEVPDGITITHWMPLPEPPKGEKHEQQKQTD